MSQKVNLFVVRCQVCMSTTPLEFCFLPFISFVSLAVYCLVFCMLLFISTCYIFPHGEFSPFSGVLSWSVQGHHRPKSDVECCMVVILVPYVFQLYIYIASLSLQTLSYTGCDTFVFLTNNCSFICSFSPQYI